MSDDRATRIERYRTGTRAVLDALADITDAELDRPAPDGGWTAREVAHHLADSETNGFIRLRRLIAEDDPVIVAYDQDEYARRIHYDRPIASSLAVLAAVRAVEPGAAGVAHARRVGAQRPALRLGPILRR